MFLINLTGLSIGLACTFLIYSFVIDQTSYDKFHKKKELIYRVINYSKEYKTSTANTPYIVGTQLRNNFPEVESVAQLFYPRDVKIKENNEFVRWTGIVSASNEFFKVFTTKTLFGNISNSLTDPNSIVLTKSIYEKYFKGQNPIGKVVELQIDEEIHFLQVAAVIDDFPKASSIAFDMLISNELVIKQLTKTEYFKTIQTAWDKSFFNTYFTLKKSSKIDFFTQNWNISEEGEMFPKESKHFSFQPLLDIHFHSKDIVNEPERGNIIYLFLFIGIGFLILLIVSINYIILSMANSESRLKEIGLKKAIGSNNNSIRIQQLIESLITSFFGFIIALIIILLCVNGVNMLFETEIEINLFGNLMQLGVFILFTISISVVSSGYVSLFLARKSPIDLLNGTTNSNNRKDLFQNALTVFQIIIFTILIAGTYSIYSQISFLKGRNPGFAIENRLHITDWSADFSSSKLLNFKEKLLECPEIEGVASGYCLPPTDWRIVSSIPIKGDPETKIILDQINASGNYLSLMDIKLVQGRYLDDKLATDSQCCVINLKAAKMLNFQEPLVEKIKEYKIVGVVEDFYSYSLIRENNPLYIILHKPAFSSQFVLKTSKKGEKKAMQFARDTWQVYFPENDVEYYSVKDKINSSFSKEDNLNQIILSFCIIAILIVAIGLYGQSLFSISKRKKEIAIRKVNGATSYKIAQLFLIKYGTLTIIANIISWPFVLYFTNKWQSNFIYKEDINLKIILISFIFSMLIVLLTVLKNTIKSSNLNPVKVLKYK